MSNLKDITGQKYGRLTVLNYAGNDKHGKAMWLCECECGNKCTVYGTSLRRGRTKSCGCLNREITTKVHIGDTFGRLTVVERLGHKEFHKSKIKQILWKCKCECGNYINVTSDSLRSGHTRSCGCLAHEYHTHGTIKHGLSGTRLYNIRIGMIDRCYNPKCKDYSNYGGKENHPTRICNEWYDKNRVTKKDPIDKIGLFNFIKWANDNGYKDDLTINRRDPNGDYCPENCEWVTLFDQGKDKRTNKYIYDGEEILIYRYFERKYNLHNGFMTNNLKHSYTYDQLIHYAKYKEWIKKDKDGIWRDKDGNQRLLRHYEQPNKN